MGGGQWQGLGQRRLCPATAAPLPSPNQLLLLRVCMFSRPARSKKYDARELLE